MTKESNLQRPMGQHFIKTCQICLSKSSLSNLWKGLKALFQQYDIKPKVFQNKKLKFVFQNTFQECIVKKVRQLILGKYSKFSSKQGTCCRDCCRTCCRALKCWGFQHLSSTFIISLDGSNSFKIQQVATALFFKSFEEIQLLSLYSKPVNLDA